MNVKKKAEPALECVIAQTQIAAFIHLHRQYLGIVKHTAECSRSISKLYDS